MAPPRHAIAVRGARAGQGDLRSATAGLRRVVFARTWSSSSGHSIRVVGQGTAGRPTITVDSFVGLP